MIVPIPQIQQLAKEEVDDWIVTAREDHKVLKMHYYGEGLEEHLEQVDQLENEDELELRRRFAISNEFLTDTLVRPFDNIFSARGGSITIDIPVDSTKELFKSQLTNVKEGLSDREYLKQVWKDYFFTDPDGLVFVEVKRDGTRAFLAQKSITQVRKMKVNGIIPEYVMFEADVTVDDERTADEIQAAKTEEEKKDKGWKLHWFVDDAWYWRVKVYNDEKRMPEILRAESKVNSFNRVPGFTNSTIIDNNRKIKVSPIWKQLGLLNKYVHHNSIHEIYVAKHGFPIFWMYAGLIQPCQVCKGTGVLASQDGQSRGGRTTENCPNCVGGFIYKKDVADALILKPPQDKDDPILEKVAGYVQPDIETWREQRTELEWTTDLLYFSLWGTTIEKDENKSRTATGRWLDKQPVVTRLNDFADIVEIVHQEIIKLFASFYVSMSFNGVSVNYGRKFILETADQIWEKYLKAKTEGASEHVLTQLLEQYYEAEYQTNDILREYWIKVMKVDPIPHTTLKELGEVTLPQYQIERKIYLREWLSTKMMLEVIDKDVDTLTDELDTYIAEQTAQE